MIQVNAKSANPLSFPCLCHNQTTSAHFIQSIIQLSLEQSTFSLSFLDLKIFSLN